MFRKISFLALIACSILLQGKTQAATKNVIWLTGLPSSGKTTIANQLSKSLPSKSLVIDGDIIRKYVNSDLGFTEADRTENLRRVTDIAIMTLDSNDIKSVIVACISPTKSVREAARKRVEGAGYRFLEVFVETPLEVCIERDVKGMYKKAIAGEIKNFTGISAPYEAPENPDITFKTNEKTVSECVRSILDVLITPSNQDAHALFIGRWSPFHRGHWAIMESVYKENPERPLLIYVRDTKEYWTPEERRDMIKLAMDSLGVPATVEIMPDVDSVNYGRDVGYRINRVDVDPGKVAISGTEIRNRLKAGDDSWKDSVFPAVADYIQEIHNIKEG
jgi:adenylylsulfate kinase